MGCSKLVPVSCENVSDPESMLKADERVMNLVVAEEAADNSLAQVQADLASREADLALAEKQQRPTLPDNNAGSLLMCLGAVVAGLVMSAHYSKEVHRLDTQTKEMSAETTRIRQEATLTSGAQINSLQRYGILASRGVPIAGLMDEVTRALVPGVGLSSVVISAGRNVRIEGEAISEQAMLQFVSNVQAGKGIRDLRPTGYGRDSLKQKGVRFTLTGKAISMADVRLGGPR